MIMSSYGEKMIGGIVAAVGGLTTAIGAWGFFDSSKLVEGKSLNTMGVVLVAGAMIANAAGALAASSSSAGKIAM
jgi:hypothetical protein